MGMHTGIKMRSARIEKHSLIRSKEVTCIATDKTWKGGRAIRLRPSFTTALSVSYPEATVFLKIPFTSQMARHIITSTRSSATLLNTWHARCFTRMSRSCRLIACEALRTRGRALLSLLRTYFRGSDSFGAACGSCRGPVLERSFPVRCHAGSMPLRCRARGESRLATA